MATYQDLVNVGGTIYNASGKGYANPTELATDLGIQAHQIDWSQISSGTTIPTAQTPTPAPTTTPAPITDTWTPGYPGSEALKTAGLTPTPTTTTDLGLSQADTFQPPTQQALSIQDSYTQSMLDTLAQQRTALEGAYQRQLEQTQKDMESAQKRYDEIIATQKDIITTDVKPLTEPFRADIETSERERLSIEKNFQENQNLVSELDTLLTGIQAEVTRQKEITGLASIRQPQIEKSVEEMTSRVGVIEAVMAARNNQIVVAENLIDRTVTAMTADRNDQLNYYNSLLNFYGSQADVEGNKIITLTAQEQDQINNQISLLEGDLATTKANVDYIKGLMLDPNTAGLMANSGVTLNDTPAEVQQKFADYTYQLELNETNNTMSQNGYTYITPEQAANKPANEVVSQTDSRGNIKHYWKKVEDVNVASLMANYPDAGILLTDTFEIARAKLAGSKIYQQQTRLTGGGATEVSSYMQLYNEAVAAGYNKSYTEFLRERGVLSEENGDERTWSDLEIKSALTAIEDIGGTKADAMQEIDLDPTIQNKERAKELAKEYFGDKQIEEETTSVPEGFFGRLFYGITHPTTGREFTIK